MSKDAVESLQEIYHAVITQQTQCKPTADRNAGPSRPPKATMWEKLKLRWNVESGWDVAVILLVFACTGFSVMYLKRWLYGLAGWDADTSGWLRWGVAIFVILPVYQVILLVWGWIWGKFDFFWRFEKKMIARLSGLFKKSGKS